MPLYNVEEYLEESIESLTGQSIGFAENIQLILVDDGSTDHSSEICRKYRALYPDNIIYIFQEHQGVSGARNTGMKYISGTYVNFMDSDDIWDRGAFQYARIFFEEHPDVGIATGRMLYLNMPGTWHHLDYMFDRTKVIDIHRNYVCPVFSAAKTFIRTDLIGGLLFDERVEIAEDALFVNTIILQQGEYGVIREARYYYRKRADRSSALDNAKHNRSYYYDTTQLVYLGLIEYSTKLYGRVIPYIQYLLITDLQWRLRAEHPADTLSAEEQHSYYCLLMECLKTVDDSIIMQQRRMTFAYKAYTLLLKYDGEAQKIPDETRRLLAEKPTLSISRITAEKDWITLTGRAFDRLIGDDYRVIAEDQDGEKYECGYIHYPVYEMRGISGDIVLNGYLYTFRLPARVRSRYSFYIINDRGYKRKLSIDNQKYSSFSDCDNSFFASRGKIYKLINDRICIYNNRLKTCAASAARYNASLDQVTDKDLTALRNRMLFCKAISRAPVIVIEDNTDSRKSICLDLFRYLKKDPGMSKCKIYLSTGPEKYDWLRSNREKGVIPAGSDKNKIIHATASLVVSADSQGRYIEPFRTDLKYYRDLLDYKYVLLKNTSADDKPFAKDDIRIDHICCCSEGISLDSICKELQELL